MAIDTIPPWIRGPDTLGATSSGASAGLGAARIQQEQQSDTARQGMEALRLRQASQLEQARLAQAAEQNQMEFQARQKTNEQMQLRADQRLNIDNAYKTATLGIQQGRLEEVEKAATEKAQSSAIQFQREQRFARNVAAGMPPMEAYALDPVSASVLNSVTRSTSSADNKSIHVGNAIVRRQPDGTYKEEYRAPNTNKRMKVGNQVVEFDEDGNPHVIFSAKKATEDVQGAAGAVNPNFAPSGKMFGGVGMIPNTTGFGPLQIGPPAAQPAKKNVPQPGEIYSGHKFKGGDPTDEDNWEEVGE